MIAALCTRCSCCFEGCGLSKFRQDYCFKHAYMHLSIEFRVICQASSEGILQHMMPQDVEVFLSTRLMFYRDEALQFIAAWIMEPAAIIALGSLLPAAGTYSGERLSRILQQVRGP